MSKEVEYVTKYIENDDGTLEQRMVVGEQVIFEQIVRCRECKYYNRGKCNCKTGIVICDYEQLGIDSLADAVVLVDVDSNGFCSKGVKRAMLNIK